MIDDTRCTREIKSRIATTKAPFYKKEALFSSKLDLDMRTKPVKCSIFSITLCGNEIGILWKVDMTNLKKGKIGWTDRVTNEVLSRVKEQRNILHTVTRRKANWIGQILCGNCLLKHVLGGKVDGRMEVTGMRKKT